MEQSHMTPTELTVWRRTNGLKQGQLAEALGKHRHTVARWENGQCPMPVDLETRLGLMATAKKKAEAPAFVLTGTARCWPQYRLYAKMHSVKLGKVYHQDEEHPCKLLPGCPHPAPAEIMDSEEYKEAVARHRADKAALPASKVADPLIAWIDRQEGKQ
jgi:DNA-binding XRE family transcriptional regulator